MTLNDFLESKKYDIRLRWIDKRTEADITIENRMIRMNLELILTNIITHEFLHDQYPKLSEAKISNKTLKYIRRMKVAEIKSAGRLTFKLMIGGKKDENTKRTF